jgi:hypothetical protein
LPKNNFETTINNTKDLKWDSLNSEQITQIVDRITKAYSIVESDYLKYYEDVLLKNTKYKNYNISGINAKEEILATSKSTSKGLKDTTQTDAILVHLFYYLENYRDF